MENLVISMQGGVTPLFIVCQKGHLPVVEQLIAAKADVNVPKEVIVYLLYIMQMHYNTVGNGA